MFINNDIILIRHGKNIINESMPNDLLPLSPLGIKQAYYVKEYLKGKFDIVFCSNSYRSIMTARIINNNYIIDSRLIERGWGNVEKDGLETNEEAKQRFISFLSENIIKYPNKRFLLVTHGSLIKIAQNIIENNIVECERVGNCMIFDYHIRDNKILRKNIHKCII